MADRFNLIKTPKLFFGAGKAKELPELIKIQGKRILLLTGSESLRNNPEIAQIVSLLSEHDYKVRHEKIGSEPSSSDIDLISRKFPSDETDLVVAIGGGSVLDAGKAVSAMITAEGKVKDYLENVGTRKHNGNKKFFVAVPTTAGTGSEATSNAVISETGPEGYKKSLRHENFVPDLAVVDPLLTMDCPAGITATTGMDAFTQLVESFLSTKSNSYTDALALDGIAEIHNCLERAVNSGHDINARSGMAYAAYISGITLANAGLGLVHGFASAIGGYYYAPHGVVCGTLMGVVNRFNIRALLKGTDITLAAEKYSRLGSLISGTADRNPAWYMECFADYIDELTERLKIPRLSAYGITDGDLLKIAAASDHKANPVKFNNDELIDMLRLRL